MAAVEVFPAHPEVAMRTIAVAVSLAFLCATAAPATAQFCSRGSELDVRHCVTHATHILVVDPQGKILEVWKGDARTGSVIPVDLFFRSAHAHNAFYQLNEPSPIPQFQRSWPGDWVADERWILFLIRSNSPDPTTKALGGWEPAAGTAGFVASIARVDRFGLVSTQPAPDRAYPAFTGIGFAGHGQKGTIECFKEWVFEIMEPTFPAAHKK